MLKSMEKYFFFALFSILVFSGCESALFQPTMNPFDPVLKPPALGTSGPVKMSVQLTDRLGDTSPRSVDCFYDIRNGCTYKLMSDVTLEKNIVVEERFTATIDLNGYVLTGNGMGSVITNHGTLIIKDSSPNKVNRVALNKMNGGFDNEIYLSTESMSGGVITGGCTIEGSHGGGGIYNTGDLFIYGGNIAGNLSETYGGGIRNNGGNINFNGGTIEGNHSPYGGGIANYEENEPELYGSTSGPLKNTVNTNSASGNVSTPSVTARSRSSVVINGGKIRNNSGEIGGGIFTKGANTAVTITAGVIENNASKESQSTEAIYAESPVNITGGMVDGKINSAEDVKILVRGGEFTEEVPDDWLGTGAVFDAESGTVNDPTRDKTSAEIEVTDDKGNVTISDETSIFVPQNGYRYKLLGNIVLSKNIFVSSGVSTTIDLNGFVLKGTGEGAEIEELRSSSLFSSVIYTTGNLTITDSNPMAPHFYVDQDDGLRIWDDENGVIDFSGGAITGAAHTNNASGSAIFNYGGNLIFERGNIVGNSAHSGGAIYAMGGTVQINGGFFVGNTASDGGVLFSERADVIVSDGVFTLNTANAGAVFYNKNGTLTIEDGSFLDNTANTNGGAVFNSGTFNLVSATIGKNTAMNRGGAVLNKGTMTMTGGIISSNQIHRNETQPRGAGIMNDVGGVLILSGGRIENNMARDAGNPPAGNVYSSGKLTVNKGVSLAGTLTAIHANSGTVSIYGGAISGGIVRGDAASVLIFSGYFSDKPKTDMLATGAKIDQNNDSDPNYPAGRFPHVLSCSFVEVTSAGGKISTETLDVLINPKDGHTYKLMGNVELENSIFVDEKIAVTLDLNGYAIFSDGRNSVILNRGDLTILDSPSLTTHKFTKTTSGLYVLNESIGTISIKGGVISGGSATSGGGIYNYGKLTVRGGNIVGNHAKSYGGGIVNNGEIYFEGGSVLGNTSDEGAGIANFESLNLTGGTVKDNSAKKNGGGIKNSKTFNFSGGVISGNMAQTGAGVQNEGTFEISDGEITANEAVGSGGGISNGKGTVTFTGGKIHANVALSGAGVHNGYSAKFIMQDGIIGNNISTSETHVLLCEGGTVSIEGGGIAGHLRKSGGVFTITGGYFATEPAGSLLGKNRNYVLNVGNNSKYPRSDFKYMIINEDEFEYLSLVEIISASEGSLGETLADELFSAPITTSDVTYKLLNDVSLHKSIIISAGVKNVTLDLNGFVIEASYASGSAISVEKAAELRLIDSNPTSPNTYMYNLGTGAYTYTNSTGDISIPGGAIAGGRSLQGGAIYNAGKLTMDGGALVGNFSGRDMGAGVYNSGTFILNRGSFRGNYGTVIYNSKDGDTSITGGGISGGIKNDGGKFSITGGYFDFEPDSSLLARNYLLANNTDAMGYYSPSVFTFMVISAESIENKVEITDLTGKTTVDSISTVKNGYIYKLLGNYNLSKTITVPAGVEATLNLNGFILSAGSDFPAITNAGTLTLEDGNNVASHYYNSSNGYYVLNETAGTIEVKGGAIYNGSAGAIKNTGTFIMKGGAVVGSRGAGIIHNSGNFTMNAGNVVGNKSSYPSGKKEGGGAIWNDTNGTFTLINGIISNNSGDAGAAIYNHGKLTVSGGIISNNTASDNGGGIYNKGTLSVTAGSISSNKANQGGALFNSGSATISAGIFDGNTASKGSTVASDGKSVIVTGGNFTGSFHEVKDDTIEISGGYFAEKVDSGCLKDGVIFIANPGDNISAPTDVYKWKTFVTPVSDKEFEIYVYTPDTLQSLKTGYTYKLMDNIHLKTDIVVDTGKNITIDLNGFILTGTGDGSVITNRGKLTVTDSNPSSSNEYTVAFPGLTVVDGNGLRNWDSAVTKLKVFGGVITGGKSTYGGGIANYGTFTFAGGCVVNNQASQGGGIYNGESSIFQLRDGNISGNTAEYGGGIYFSDALNAEITGGMFVHNLVEYSGGAVYVANNKENVAALKISGGTISQNVAKDRGGAIGCTSIFDDGYSIVISGGSVTGNRSKTSGGLGPMTPICISGGLFESNIESPEKPGENYATGGTSRVEGGGFKDLLTGNWEICGGFFAVAPDNKFLHSSYRRVSNSGSNPDYPKDKFPYSIILAAPSGGVVSVTSEDDFGDLSLGSTYRLTSNVNLTKPLVVASHVDTTIDLNGFTLKQTGDTGIIFNLGTLKLVSNTGDKGVLTGGTGFSDNAETGAYLNAATGGGAIYNFGTVTLTNVEVSGNTGRHGGGIFNTGKLTVENSVISNNSGCSGGGIYNHYSGEMFVKNTKISGNIVKPQDKGVSGGGIYLALSSYGELDNVEITGNLTEQGAGGGIFCNGKLKVNNSIIKDNSATNGAVAAGASATRGGRIYFTNSGIADAILPCPGAADKDGFIGLSNCYTATNFSGSNFAEIRTLCDFVSNPGDNSKFSGTVYKYKAVSKPVVQVRSEADFGTIKSNTVYKLMSNIKLTKPLEINTLSEHDAYGDEIPVDKVVLDLNGYVLAGSGKAGEPVIKITNIVPSMDTYVAIIDSNPDAPQYYNVESSGLYKWSENGGSVELRGGAITGGFGENGGGISVTGIVNCFIGGINIVGNTATKGGGLYANFTDPYPAVFVQDVQVVGNVSTSGGNAFAVENAMLYIIHADVYGNSGSDSDILSNNKADCRIFSGGFNCSLKLTNKGKISIRGGFFANGLTKSWVHNDSLLVNNNLLVPKYPTSVYPQAVTSKN